MAGQGAAPFYSSWHGGGYAPATALFYSPDPDTAEQTIWTDWWFEAAVVSVNLTPDAGQIIITGYAPTLDVGAALVVYDWFIRVRRRRRS